MRGLAISSLSQSVADHRLRYHFALRRHGFLAISKYFSFDLKDILVMNVLQDEIVLVRFVEEVSDEN